MARNLGIFGWEESNGAQPQGMSDADGRFELRGVAPGAYRVKWAPADSEHWIKRLKDGPDLFVDAGHVTDLGALRTRGRIR